MYLLTTNTSPMNHPCNIYKYRHTVLPIIHYLTGDITIVCINPLINLIK